MTLYTYTITAILLCVLAALASCSTNTVQRAGEGALLGAAAGAVGGMFSAAIFGGSVGEAAARGAAWGAGTGAVTGAIRGSREDAAREQKAMDEQRDRQKVELARLRSEIGEDAYAGLEALTLGKHEVALAYARTAMREANAQHALAGRWLEVLSYSDRGQDDQVQRSLPNLVTADPEVSSVAQAYQTLAELTSGLQKIRNEFNLSPGG